MSVKVAVIDSGLCESHPKLKGVRVTDRVSVGSDGISRGCTSDVWGHGTACTQIIHSVLDRELRRSCEFKIVKVFDRQLVVSQDILLKALLWCMDSGVDVISVSIGVRASSPPQELVDLCLEAHSKGIILVAPDHNEGDGPCYPASLSHVFGVTGGVLRSRREFGVNEESDIEFVGRGTNQRVAWINDSYIFDSGTSFASAQLAGIVCNVRAQFPESDPSELKAHLMSIGLRGVPITSRFVSAGTGTGRWAPQGTDTIEEVVERNFSPKRFSWMRRAALYPVCNKEFHAIEHFSRQCQFELVEILDFPKGVISHRDIEIDGRKYTKKWRVSDIERSFDTLIVGYPYETPFGADHKAYKDILDQAWHTECNFFCLSGDVEKQLQKERDSLGKVSSQIYCPRVDTADLQRLACLQSEGETTRPVLAVVGTNEKQGKFSLQLRIKKVMEDAGYEVGWLSTEPQGELFGASFAFPYGYNGTVALNPHDWPVAVSCAIRGIEMAGSPDIIITGHQSGLLPYTRGNLADIYLQHLTFLSGCRADAAACVISPEDDIRTVEDVIGVLQHLLRVPVLFFALHRNVRSLGTLDSGKNYVKVRRLKEAEWQERARELRSRFGIPVIDSHSEHYDSDILRAVEDCFA